MKRCGTAWDDIDDVRPYYAAILPWQNGDAESFKGKFRDECLSLEWFRSCDEARVVIETWRRHYNHVRPHSSLKDLTPVEFKTRYDSTTTGAALNFCMVQWSLGRSASEA